MSQLTHLLGILGRWDLCFRNKVWGLAINVCFIEMPCKITNLIVQWFLKDFCQEIGMLNHFRRVVDQTAVPWLLNSNCKIKQRKLE